MRVFRFIMVVFILTGCFLISPVSAEVTVLGELSHEYVFQPGANHQGVIEVMNMGETEQMVRVYQTDYTYQADGTSKYAEVGSVARSNAVWIQISPKQFAVPAGEKAIVNYAIQVPDTMLSGSFWSMIMVEPLNEISPEKSEGIQIVTVVRYGVQIITQIGNSGHKSIQFQDAQLVRDEEGRFLQVDLGNDGERFLEPNLWVEIFDTTGQFKGKFETRQARLLPGCSSRRKIDVTSLEAGEYKALIIADCGDEDIFGMNLTLKIIR